MNKAKQIIKTVSPWLWRLATVAMAAYMLYHLYTQPQSLLADKVIFTVLILACTMYVLALSGIMGFVLEVYEWISEKGGLVIMIALILIYVFLRALT